MNPKLTYKIKNYVYISLIVLILLWAVAIGQNIADSFKVKVTYYDFHQDMSNPAFQVHRVRAIWPAKVGITKGLVQQYLDSEGKPQLAVPNPDSCYYMFGFQYWFRQWKPGNFETWIWPADTLIVAVTDSSNFRKNVTFWGDTVTIYETYYDSTFFPPDTVVTDTLYKNVAVEDSILFVRGSATFISFAGIDTNTKMPLFDTLKLDPCYKFFYNGKFGEWFPLTGRGLQKPTDTANGCFTMEMHNKFIYNGGEKVFMKSDDESWLFIDNKLALDLGGMHEAGQGGYVCLDSLGLTVGQTYDFALFYAERLFGAVLEIATDIEFLETSLNTKAANNPKSDLQNSEEQMHGNSSVSNEEKKNKGLCGSGWLMAIFPPILTYNIRKIINKKSKRPAPAA